MSQIFEMNVYANVVGRMELSPHSHLKMPPSKGIISF